MNSSADIKVNWKSTILDMIPSPTPRHLPYIVIHFWKKYCCYHTLTSITCRRYASLPHLIYIAIMFEYKLICTWHTVWKNVYIQYMPPRSTFLSSGMELLGVGLSVSLSVSLSICMWKFSDNFWHRGFVSKLNIYSNLFETWNSLAL